MNDLEEFANEPNWIRIGNLYIELGKAAQGLQDDINRYKAALSELDGAGTSISNGKDRIFLIREQIEQIEAAAKMQATP